VTCPPEIFGVSGIWFDSTTHGVVTLAGALEVPPMMMGMPPTSMGGPGAIFAMTGPNKQGALLFDGQNNTATMSTNRPLNFNGLVVSSYGSPAGLIAITERDALVQSTDNGATFKLSQTGIMATSQDDISLWLSQTTTGSWVSVDQDSLLLETIATAATTAPSKTLNNPTWTAQYPKQPAPTGDCFSGNWFLMGGAPPGNPNFYASPDGKTMMFATQGLAPSMGTIVPGVCRSINGGVDFKLVSFPNLPPDEMASTPLGPTALVFKDALHGIAAAGNAFGTEGDHVPYVYTTTDGGATWVAATTLPGPPAFGNKNGFTIVNAFYSQTDALHVWILGTYAPNATTLPTTVLWRSTDGGKTFTDVSASIASWIAAQPSKTIVDGWATGFALDDNNIWIGGIYEHFQQGVLAGDHTAFLLYSSTGGT
jgi:hypothetical protein